MGRASEMLVRAALQQTRLDGGALFEESDSDAFAVGARVLAYWEEADEWYDAVVEDFGDDWIVVWFEEWDYSGELPFDDDHVLPHPDPTAGKHGGGNAGASARQPRARAAKVPPPPAGAPHRAAREALPVYEHRAELLSAIESNQVVVIEGETGCGKSTQVPQYVVRRSAREGAGTRGHTASAAPPRSTPRGTPRGTPRPLLTCAALDALALHHSSSRMPPRAASRAASL